MEIEPEKIIQEGQVFTGETEVTVKTDKFLVEDVTLAPLVKLGARSPLQVRIFHRLYKQLDTVNDLLKAVRREAADLLDQIVLIHSVELGNIDDTALRQAGFTFFEENVSSCFGAPQVRGQGAEDNRADAAFVEDIVLNDDVGTKKSRTRARGCSQRDPIDLSLPNHHSPFIRFLCF